MGGFVSDFVGGITGGLLGGEVGGEAESTAQTVNNGLQAGDTVALLPVNGGKAYIVLGKLAYAAELSGETSEDTSGVDTTLTTAASIIGGVT